MNDTYNFEIWEENIVALKEILTKHAKVFTGHDAINEGCLLEGPDQLYRSNSCGVKSASIIAQDTL